MTQAASPMGQLTWVERCLLGLLAMAFVATEIAGLALPPQSFRFIQPREVTKATPRVLEDLGPGLKISIARVDTTQALRLLLDDGGLDLDAIRRGQAHMPALFLASLPEDLADIKTVEERKNLFVAIVLPLILHHNSVVLERRKRLLSLANSSGGLSGPNQRWLVRLARLYRVIQPQAGFEKITAAGRVELLRRVDLIPVSLAMAQSAAESGWGTSRFARQGNALFGQWTWDQTSGLVPSDRDEGRAHAVRAFGLLANSVRAYVHNLNVSHHYAEFRFARALLRRVGPPNGTWGHILIGHLEKYSEEGVDYINKVRSIIRVNRFGDFETSQIAATARVPREAPPDS
jgi:Bax protein